MYFALLARCFTSLCYTADGTCVLAGGKSKFVCIYNIEQQVSVVLCSGIVHTLVHLYVDF